MTGWGRAFQREISPRKGSDGQSPRPAPPRYGVLMEVTIVHRFYNRERYLCSDFTFAPTPATAALLASIGLLLLVEPTRFAVLYDVYRKEELEHFLRQRASIGGSPPALQHWSRLSFTLTLRNMLFANLTRMPLDMSPLDQNFYLSNRQAHEEGPVVFLNPGTAVSEAEILPAEPAEFARTIPCGSEIVVYDVSGDEVARVPTHCVGELDERMPLDLFDRVYVDLSTKPEGWYRYEVVRKRTSPPELPTREPGALDGSSPLAETFVYSTSAPLPLVFVDLFFTSPDGEPTGVYPISGLGPDEEFMVSPVRYQLHFDARSTYWRYYIVPPPHVSFTDLSITSVTPPDIVFDGPWPVVLPNLREAYCFTSTERIMLEQRSSVRLCLSGRREDDDVPSPGVLLDPLPLAPPASVQPHPRRPDRSPISEIYVYV